MLGLSYLMNTHLNGFRERDLLSINTFAHREFNGRNQSEIDANGTG